MATGGLGGLGGGCGAGARAGAASCGAGCGAAVGTGFGVRVFAGSPTGVGFDAKLGVLVVAEMRLGSGGTGCFSFPLDTGGIGI